MGEQVRGMLGSGMDKGPQEKKDEEVTTEL
jgi:hypothetical protein